MLILTRKLGESIEIEGNIRITIIEIKGKQVRVKVEAPSEINVSRRAKERSSQERK